MTRKRKAQTDFQEVEFESQTDDDEKEALGEKDQSLPEKNRRRKKGNEMKIGYVGKFDSMDREGVWIQGDDDDGDEHKEATVERKRKRRKRKPRNNKYEGMSKKSMEGMPAAMQKVEIVRVQSSGHEGRRIVVMPSSTGRQGKTKAGTNQGNGSTLEIDSKSIEKCDNTGMKAKRKRKKKKKVKAKDQTNNGNHDDGRQIETKEGNDIGKLESNTSDVAVVDESEIIYASKKKPKRKNQIWKNSRESWGHQLKSARFRFINETLYMCSGDESFRKFKGDRSLFEVYHKGYNQQIEQWPENPVDVMIEYLNKRPQTWTVGDFGCGEANIGKNVKQKVYCFDIFPANERVTVCNISKVPLQSESLDVAIYCLSLMGINWIDYLREANRVLRPGGILKIAEVASRFQAVDSFIEVLHKLGFQLKTKDLSNKMFFLFEFGKTKSCKEVPSSFGSILKPCQYKRR